MQCEFLSHRLDISKLDNNILYEYYIFNNSNFYFSPLGKKNGFLGVEFKVRVININIRFISMEHNLWYKNT